MNDALTIEKLAHVALTSEETARREAAELCRFESELSNDGPYMSPKAYSDLKTRCEISRRRWELVAERAAAARTQLDEARTKADRADRQQVAEREYAKLAGGLNVIDQSLSQLQMQQRSLPDRISRLQAEKNLLLQRIDKAKAVCTALSA